MIKEIVISCKSHSFKVSLFSPNTNCFCLANPLCSQEIVHLTARNNPLATNTTILIEYVTVEINCRVQPTISQKNDNNKVTESEPMLSMDALHVHGVTESTWLSTVNAHKIK